MVESTSLLDSICPSMENLEVSDSDLISHNLFVPDVPSLSQLQSSLGHFLQHSTNGVDPHRFHTSIVRLCDQSRLSART